MNYEIISTENFKKEAKKLIKKYPSLKLELSALGEILQENPNFGIPLGNNIFKIRLAIASKGKGKSGGARIISLVKVSDEIVYLLTIFNKSEQDSISQKDISEILKSEDLL